MEDTILIYTDGGAKKNVGSSYAFVIVDPTTFEITHQQCKYLSQFGNGYVELCAMIEALKFAKENHPFKTIIVLTDCTTNIYAFEKVINLDVDFFEGKSMRLKAKELLDLVRTPELNKMTVEHVKAHRNNYFNNYVDKLCKQSIKTKLDHHNQEKIPFFQKMVEKIMREIAIDNFQQKSQQWIASAQKGIQFPDTPLLTFNYLNQYVGNGECAILSLDSEDRKILKSISKINQLYIEEKKPGRVRFHKTSICDYMIDHPKKPLIGKTFALFNSTVDMATQYSKGIINNNDLIEMAHAQNKLKIKP